MIKANRPKDQLIDILVKHAEKLTLGVSDQFNKISINNTITTVKKLNQVQCCLVIRAISKAEEYDPSKDKYGFGPVKISPLNYSGFIEKVLGVKTEEVDFPEGLFD